MSKTLPSAISAGKGGDSERVLLVRIIPEDGDSWLEYDFATKDITIAAWEGGDDKTFSGGVLEKDAFDPIRESIDILQGGNAGTISGLEIRLANPQFTEDSAGDVRFDQEVDTYDFENRTVEIWLAFYTGSNPDYTDIHMRYRGIIVDVEYDYGTYVLKIENASSSRHIIIPKKTITEEDFSNCPRDNIGKPQPLIYGYVWDTGIVYDTFKAVPTIKIDEHKEKYLVSGNKCTELYIASETAEIDYAQIYDRNTNCYLLLRFDPGTGRPYITVNLTRPTTIEFPMGQAMTCMAVKQPDVQGEKTNPSSLDFSNALDYSYGTYLQLTTGQKLYVKVAFPPDMFTITEGTFIYMAVLSLNAVGDSGAQGLMRYYNPDWNGGTGKISDGSAITPHSGASTKLYLLGSQVGADNSAHGKLVGQGDQNDVWQVSELNTYEWGIECGDLDYIQIANIYIYLYWASIRRDAIAWLKPVAIGARRRPHPAIERIEAVQHEFDNVTVQPHGEPFGDWIDDSNRDSQFDEGGYIDSIHIIEAILRSELGLGDNEINTESFDLTEDYRYDNGSGEYRYWQCGGIIKNQKNSLDVIKELCKTFCTIYFTNYENKETILPFAKRTSVKTIDRTTIEKDSIKISKTSLDDVYNEFYINWSRDHVRGNFDRTMYLNGSDHNMPSSGNNDRDGTPDTYTGLCADSQDKYKFTRRFDFDCEWVGNPSYCAQTVTEIIRWFAEWLCYRKYIVELKTAGLDHIDLEIGDQVKIDHTLLPEELSNDAHFMLFDIVDDLNKNKMHLKFVQIPDLLF